MLLLDILTVIVAVIYIIWNVHKEAPGAIIRGVGFAFLLSVALIVPHLVGMAITKDEIVGHVAILATYVTPFVCGLIYCAVSDWLNKP